VEFILAALQQVADHHDNLLELVGDVSEEYPFVALRLLQVCAVNRFEHILSAGPPEAASLFAEQRDLAITNVLAVVQGFPVDPATTTHDLPMVAGWAGLPPLQRIAFASYLGAFFRVAEPLVHRLMQMRGTTTSMVAGLLEDPTSGKDLGQDWAISVSTTMRGRGITSLIHLTGAPNGEYCCPSR
jgi:hypothetical protein